MKNWTIIVLMMSILFAGFTSAQAQDTTDQARIDSLKMKIEDRQQDLEEIAEEIAVLVEKLGRKASKEMEKEITRELKEALNELKDEMKEIKVELDEELEEEWDDEDNGEEWDDEDIDEDNDWGEVLDGLDIKFNRKKDKLKNVKTRWILIDLGFGSYVAHDDLPTLNGLDPMEPDILNSVSWRLHVLNQRINVASHYLNLLYGVGFSFNFYGFSNPSTILPSSPQVNFTLPDDNQISYKKNHLRASYLHIPLMLNIETNPYQKSKSFHINAGVYGNVLLGGKTTQKTNNRKTKIKDKYNLENFQYGLLAQLGYGPITFYGTYGLNELFKPEKDNGYTVHPITFGVKLLPF